MVTAAPYRPMRRIQKMALMAVFVACLSFSATADITALTANGSTTSDTGTTPTPTTTAPPPTTTAPPPTTTAPPPTTTTPPPTTTKPTPTTSKPTPTTKTPSGDGSGNPEVTTPPPSSTTAPPTTTTPEPTTTTTAPPTSTTKTPKPSTTRGSGSSSVDGLNNAGNGDLTTPTPAPSSQKSYGVIIGVAVVAAVVLIALGFVIYRHRSRKDDEDKELRRQLDQMDLELGSAAYAMAAGSGSGSGGNGSGSGPRGSSDPRRSSLQFKNTPGRSPASWSSGRTTLRGSDSDSLSPIWRNPELLAVKIPFEKIRFGDVLSRGGFGEVLTGVYHQQRVAIKRLLPEHRRRMASLEDFLKEALLLSTLDHPRVISFVGVAWDSPRDLCLVLEFMENGDLRNILTQWHEEGRKTGWNDPRKVRIALHIAEALTYLHTLTPKIVHRDLKSKNILVNGHWDAKISDFGVSREESTHNTMTTNVGSSLWIAPEVMVGNNYDEKADIFSFGVVLSELDSMQLPYHNVRTPDGRKLPDAAVLHMVTMGKVQAEFSSMSRTDMVLLGRACLAVDPAQRPTAGEVRYRLTQILSSY